MGMVCYENKKIRKNSTNNEKKQNNSSEKWKDKDVEEKIKKNKINNSNEKKSNNSNEKNSDKKKSDKKKSDKKSDINSVYEELLKQHNKIRKEFKSQNLSLNDDLKILAQNFADNFDILKDSNLLDNNYKGQPLGINYKVFNGDIKEINKICEEWIKEKEYYNEIKNKGENKAKDYKKYFSKTKHFTQIIWKKTREVGFGYSQLNNNEKIFVAFYFPAGNILNEFNENISL